MVGRASPLLLSALLVIGGLAASLANDEVRSEMRWTQAKLKGGTTTTDSGLQYLDVKVGKGPLVESGDSAKVMYKLYGVNSGGGKHGRHIYSQSSPSTAFDLTAGAGSVIKGFDEAVLGMRVGGRRYAVLPSEIAYGAGGQASFGIEGGEALVYFLEIASIAGKGEL
jgi:FKBP-type peptidyl-prolyl cis-trans isomerase